MHWHHIRLPFARQDSIDLYVGEESGLVHILTGDDDRKVCFAARRVIGHVKDICWDQRRRPVPWKLVPLPPHGRAPEIDSRHNEIVPGFEPTLDDLTHDIANAMNRTFKDRGFSRYAKRRLVGAWKAEESILRFAADGSYNISGPFAPSRFPAPPTGRWFTGRNMLGLMNDANDGGVRIALVSVDEKELRFHGRHGALFHVYERA